MNSILKTFNKISFISSKTILLFFTFFSLSKSIYSYNIELKIKNDFNEIIYTSTTINDEHKSFFILPKETKLITGTLEEGQTFHVKLMKDKSKEPILFNVSWKDKKNILKYYIPATGAITDLGCSWNKKNIIKPIQIESLIKKYWIPFFDYCQILIDIELRDNTNERISEIKYPLVFTIFAIFDETVKEIKLNSSQIVYKNINQKTFDLSAHEVSLKTSLSPVVFKTDKHLSRWVDLIIHNYSNSTYILYALKKQQGFEHIRFDYKNQTIKNNIVFYPPLTQMRGPGFRFSAEKLNNNDFAAHPSFEEAQKGDEYFLILGSPDKNNNTTLNYIPIKLNSYSFFGYSLKNGINVKSDSETALVVSFTPFNCSFSIEPGNHSTMQNLIRVPINENGEKAFQLKPMSNIKVNLVPQNSTSGQIQTGRNAVIYEVSGISQADRLSHKYKIILIAPPFLNGNSPGIYYPFNKISQKYKIGNYIRYPLHIYVLPINQNGKEGELLYTQSKTELPDNLIGNIKYFISDNITGNENQIHKILLKNYALYSKIY